MANPLQKLLRKFTAKILRRRGTTFTPFSHRSEKIKLNLLRVALAATLIASGALAILLLIALLQMWLYITALTLLVKISEFLYNRYPKTE